MLFTIAVVVLLLYLYSIDSAKRNGRCARMLKDVPGRDGLPLVGTAFDFVCTPVSFFYKARELSNEYQNKHKIFKFWALGYPSVWLYDPEDIEILLSSTKNITKGMVYFFVYEWLKQGLLTSTGEKWQRRRKILTPTFHFNILRQFCKVFVEQSKDMVRVLKNEIGKEETSLMPLMTNYALQSIGETAMGLKMDDKQDEMVQYKNSIYEMGESVVYRAARPWLHRPFIYDRTDAAKKQKEILNTLQTFTTNVINARRISMKHSQIETMPTESEEEESEVGMKKRLAMLDLLLKAEENGEIDERGILEEVDTFMFEGHDTTTVGLSFALMILANHPEIQDKIIAELEKIFQGDNRAPTFEDLNNMNYLEMCIKESLRMYPSVPFISRHLTEDLKLKKYTIPAGSNCDLHIFDIHRNPTIFINPDTYDPDRFLPENARKRHPYSFLSFSAGPRNCIGQRFALYEMKVALSTIFKHFKLEPVTKPEDIVFVSDIVLRTRDPLKVKFVPR